MIAVVIPYYRGKHFIEACVRSVLDTTGTDVSVTIVDNDPDGLSVDFDDPRVRSIRCRPNIGYGRAANAGVDRAIAGGARHIVVTNQDVVFEAGAIDELARRLTPGKPDVILPLLKSYDLLEVDPHFVARSLTGTTYLEDDAGGGIQETYSAPIASGACFAIHANTIARIGLFDPVFHMYGEDDDLFGRVRAHGGELVVATRAVVGHYDSMVNSVERREAIRLQQRIASDILYIRGSSGLGRYLVLRSVKNTLAALLRRGPAAFFEEARMRWSHLGRWQALRAGDPAAVKSRSQAALHYDVVGDG